MARAISETSAKLTEPKRGLLICPVDEVVSYNALLQHDYLASHSRTGHRAENGLRDREVASIHPDHTGDVVWKIEADGHYTSKRIR